MKPKKTIKAKSPIRLRSKKLANGNESLFLDIYADGVRAKEYLKLYLVPVKTPIDRVTNDNTLRAAEAIRAQRLLEITNDKAKIKTDKPKDKVYLVEWLKSYAAEKGKRGNLEMSRMVALIADVVKDYKGERVTMANVDKDFILGYINFLSTRKSQKVATDKSSKKAPKVLAKTTQHNYCIYFGCALNEAVRSGVLKENPFNLLDRNQKIKTTPSKREYLTIDEIKTLIATDSDRPQIKMAYLFSAFCGLRISDVRALTWGNLVEDNGQTKAEIIVKKTKSQLSVPLSTEALKWLPERGGAKDGDLIFDLPASVNLCNGLKRWGEKAGIKKHITFHTSRHTFATMMLTLGADLYTTSKLLGHANVGTTQIYAKIVDKKKVEAVNLVDGVFGK